jgi:imidazole glycerol phosphate synthase subunit HisF
MRVGANLILKNGLACQSHNWNSYRQIGTLQTALNALTRYSVDEINITSLSYKDNIDLKNDIEILQKCFCSTPITFGGGINNDNVNLIFELLPAERYSFCSSILENQVDFIKRMTSVFGRQSIIGIMPIKLFEKTIKIFNPTIGLFVPLTDNIISRYIEICDEIVIYDVNSDGLKCGFDFRLVEKIPIKPNKIIISGGITRYDISTAIEIGLSAVYVDNAFLHRENGLM